MPERIFDLDDTFVLGAKSDSDPGQIPIGHYWMALNMLNVGGTLSCRPGYRCIISLPSGNLQGATLFRPRVGLEQIVICINGAVYVAEYPFKEFRQLKNVLMSSDAKQIFWAQAEQSARRLTDDLTSAIEVIDTKSVLIMQDGGITAPAFYDGVNDGHIRDKPFETPIGGPMKWVGDRLWVANGRQVFASDIANPFSFREQIYLGGISAFEFPGDVTAMAITPSLEFPQLLVFTEFNGTLIQANIRERALWVQTVNMSQEIFRVGCSSNRSVVSHFGQLAWFSPSGFVTLDTALTSKHAARLPTKDNEMLYSKMVLHSDLSLVAGGAFGEFIVMSVPAEDLFNKHTWVLNSASYDTLRDDSGPSWAGFWLGTRPIEWVHGIVAGTERIYHVSTDADGNNRLWEAFLPERLDNGCPITWACWTRGYFGASSRAPKNFGTDCKACYMDVALTGIEEPLDLGIYYAGGMRGAFKRIATKQISVLRGSLSFDKEINSNSKLFAFKPQARIIRTEDIKLQNDSVETGSCPVERDLLEDTDESFQLLIVGHGPATIRWIRAHASPETENFNADAEACQDETAHNALRFDGQGSAGSSFDEVFENLSKRELEIFLSNQTQVVTQSGATSVGVGSGESIVSQEAADRVANSIATRQAEFELARNLAPVLSVGEGL